MTTRRRVHRPLVFFVGLLAAALAAIGNALRHDTLRRAFATQPFKRAIPTGDLDGGVQCRAA